MRFAADEAAESFNECCGPVGVFLIHNEYSSESILYLQIPGDGGSFHMVATRNYMEKKMKYKIVPIFALGFLAQTALGHGITSSSDTKITPAFDITEAEAATDGRLTTFIMEVVGEAAV